MIWEVFRRSLVFQYNIEFVFKLAEGTRDVDVIYEPPTLRSPVPCFLFNGFEYSLADGAKYNTWEI